MKKIILALILVLSLSVLTFANELPENIFDANSLQIHMRKNFYYGNDRLIPNYFEYVQLPNILEFTKVGDCDDFAVYSFYYLSIMNYEAQPYILFIKDNDKIEGHAITVFLDSDNTYSIFSNRLILKTLKTDPIDAIKDVYKDWQAILKWYPSKFGYLTEKDIYDNCIPVEFININTTMLYYLSFLDFIKIETINYE